MCFTTSMYDKITRQSNGAKCHWDSHTQIRCLHPVSYIA